MKYDGFISYSHAADGQLAPMVQSGLQRLAKSWYQLRALHIFRDTSSLSASPALWDSIEAALSHACERVRHFSGAIDGVAAISPVGCGDCGRRQACCPPSTGP